MNSDQLAELAVKPEQFVIEEALPGSLFDEVTEVRIHHPQAIDQEARRRARRARLTPDGKLALVALDHPGRGVTQIRKDCLAMGDRYQLLARARRVLDNPDLDGVLATGDLLEELLILSHLEWRRKGASFLDGRVLVGSMNRGGLSGTAFEMEDTFTCMTAERLVELRCDGGKMLYRLDPQDPASGRTIQACAGAINALRRHRLAVFVEPLEVRREAGAYLTVKDAAALIRQCGIAAALGESSARMWLKLPYSDDFERVCRATTLPILLLGGPARETPTETLRDFASGLAASSRVRGVIMGRNLLFPGDEDPLPMCRALTALVHHGAGLDKAVRVLAEPCPAGAQRSGRKPSHRRR